MLQPEMIQPNLVGCLIITIIIPYTFTIQDWRDNLSHNVEYDNIINDNIRLDYNDLIDINTEKRNIEYPQSKAKKIQFFDTSHPQMCSCGMDLRLIDLGAEYFPRYIPTGTCSKDSCNQMMECFEREYRILVLKERAGDTGMQLPSNQKHIPVNLQNNWITDFVMVTVSCECRSLAQ